MQRCLQMPTFSEWLQAELDRRKWSKAEFARQSGMDRGTVSNLLNEARNPGKVMVTKIARAFKMEPATVLFHAGFPTSNPDGPEEELSPAALEILDLLRERTETEKEAALAALRALFETLGRGKNGRSNSEENRESTTRKK